MTGTFEHVSQPVHRALIRALSSGLLAGDRKAMILKAYEEGLISQADTDKLLSQLNLGDA